VELAGAIADVARKTLPPDFRRIDPRCARVLLIEAGPRLLPAFPEKLSAYVAKALNGMDVEVLAGTPVTNCTEQGVELGPRRIEAGTIIWAAGVVASPAAAWLDVPHDRVGRVPVGSDLSVSGLPGVYVVGDAAAVGLGPDRLVPGLAAAAKQMGRYVGRCIAAKARGAPPPGPFRYRHQGDLATIGRRAAVVNLKHLHLTGFLGWLFWSAAHIYFLIGFRSRFVVAFSWAWQYLTFQRGARLITDAERAASVSPKDHPLGPIPTKVGP
jgi:NADH dehydrogenase